MLTAQGPQYTELPEGMTLYGRNAAAHPCCCGRQISPLVMEMNSTSHYSAEWFPLLSRGDVLRFFKAPAVTNKQKLGRKN